MLFRKKFLEAIALGKVHLAFRRWRRPTVKSGGTLKTAAGLIRIDSIAQVPISSLSRKDAVHAGFATLEELLAELSSRKEGAIFRIELHLEGPDPRIALRDQPDLSPDEFEAIRARLGKFDASSPHGPWTRVVLESIGARPMEKAGDMAIRLGFPKEWLKVSIRKLKNLGLTISHEPGYELSRRGRKVSKLLPHR